MKTVIVLFFLRLLAQQVLWNEYYCNNNDCNEISVWLVFVVSLKLFLSLQMCDVPQLFLIWLDAIFFFSIGLIHTHTMQSVRPLGTYEVRLPGKHFIWKLADIRDCWCCCMKGCCKERCGGLAKVIQIALYQASQVHCVNDRGVTLPFYNSINYTNEFEMIILR